MLSVCRINFLWWNLVGIKIRVSINDDDDELKFSFGENPLFIYVESDGRLKTTTAAMLLFVNLQD